MGIQLNNRTGIWKWCTAWLTGPTDPRDQIIEALDDTIKRDRDNSFRAHAIVIEIDNFPDIRQFRSGKDVRHILNVIQLRLKGGCFLPDVVRRLDGDQFSIAVSPMRGVTQHELEVLCAEAQREISKPIQLEHSDIKISASIGCASSNACTCPTGENLLEAARAAAVEAAQHAPATILAYSSEMAERIAQRRALLTDAVQAIKTGEIQAFFQPQICLTTNKISGFEALARWNHHVRGLISPGEFLPLLEDAGMMRNLGLVMLRDALRALRDWDSAGFNVPNVSVNMSTEELRDPELVDVIRFELDAFGLEPSRLVIEVLETVVASGPGDVLIKNLHLLSDLGCGIDLDDFGTGQASITTIREFAINRIKIDRSFVSHIENDEGKQKMVATILAIAKSLSIETLAEGVETLSEVDHMSNAGCGHAQGFYIAKPLAASDATAWIAARAGYERRVS